MGQFVFLRGMWWHGLDHLCGIQGLVMKGTIIVFVCRIYVGIGRIHLDLPGVLSSSSFFD